jgi:hypothetical protein
MGRPAQGCAAGRHLVGSCWLLRCKFSVDCIGGQTSAFTGWDLALHRHEDSVPSCAALCGPSLALKVLGLCTAIGAARGNPASRLRVPGVVSCKAAMKCMMAHSCPGTDARLLEGCMN